MKRSLLVLVFLAGCSSRPPSLAMEEADFELAGPCVVALEADARPVVRLDLGVGEPRRFLLDTGSSISLIDGRCADALGLERRPYASSFETVGSGGVAVPLHEYVRPERLGLGALVVHAARLTVLDDGALAQSGVDGLLGQDLLARLVLVLDRARDVVHVLPSGGHETIRAYLAEAEVGQGDWAVQPLELRPCPFLKLEVQGVAEPFELELDTGAVSTSLPDAALAALGLESIGASTQGTVGGSYTTELYRLEGLGLFGLRLDLDVTAARTAYGLLGMDVLGELVLVLDGPEHTLWLHRRE